ncbi:MAG: hypothetical protein WD273_05035 [Trueperaceae bacterium]
MAKSNKGPGERKAGEPEEKPATGSRGAGREDDTGDGDLEETLDRERHGSGEFDPAERYGRRDVFPDRTRAEPGDEDEFDGEDSDHGGGSRGSDSPRKQRPD